MSAPSAQRLSLADLSDSSASTLRLGDREAQAAGGASAAGLASMHEDLFRLEENVVDALQGSGTCSAIALHAASWVKEQIAEAWVRFLAEMAWRRNGANFLRLDVFHRLFYKRIFDQVAFLVDYDEAQLAVFFEVPDTPEPWTCDRRLGLDETQPDDSPGNSSDWRELDSMLARTPSPTCSSPRREAEPSRAQPQD